MTKYAEVGVCSKQEKLLLNNPGKDAAAATLLGDRVQTVRNYLQLLQIIPAV